MACLWLLVEQGRNCHHSGGEPLATPGPSWPEEPLLSSVACVSALPRVAVVQSLSHVRLLWPHELQHARPPCPPLSPGVCSSSCPLSRWCYLTISSSVALFSFCRQSFRGSGSFPVNWLNRWPKYWSSSFSISPSNEYSGLISFRIDWFDLLAVQETLKRFFQHHNSKASILQCWAFFMVQLSHPYMPTWKTIALTIRTFVSKVTSLLFNSSILTIPSFICFLFSLKSSPFFQSSLSNQCFTQRQNYLS